jgi:uncharacterized membrane protein
MSVIEFVALILYWLIVVACWCALASSVLAATQSVRRARRTDKHGVLNEKEYNNDVAIYLLLTGLLAGVVWLLGVPLVPRLAQRPVHRCGAGQCEGTGSTR